MRLERVVARWDPSSKTQSCDGDELEVAGPFDTHGEVLDDVVVRFLIIPDGSNTPIFGTAKIPNDELKNVTAPIETTHAEDERSITSGTFRKTVDVHTEASRVGDQVRAIGLSVAVKKADGHDPPAFETFTWCVTVQVVRPVAPQDGSRQTQSIVCRKSSTRSRNASGSSTCGMWLDSSKIVHCAPGMRSWICSTISGVASS